MKPSRLARRPTPTMTLFVLVLAFLASGFAQERPAYFGGTYAGLVPEQRRFVDDLATRFSEIFDKEVSAEDLYDHSPQGARTTFEAVSNALMSTRLSDDSGKPLGTALDFVESVDAVKGKVPGSRGDLQFRIYVQLRPEAIERLTASTQFHRAADNTIYHKGYPICFRQPGVPSVQVSISEDTKRADIDVDYRSSKFPVALFNGHLSAANSDVRAGNNFSRHTERWQGLVNWWRGWFGLPLLRESDSTSNPDEGLFSTTPRAGTKKIQEAAKDFLEAWLIEQKPGEALAYVDDEALECFQSPGDQEVVPTLIRAHMLKNMIDANHLLGSIDSLSAVATGIRLPTKFSRVVLQPYHQQFVVYDLPADRAEAIRCAGREEMLASVPESVKGPYGRFYGSAFYLTGPAGRGAALYLLWHKRGGHWRIVSFARDVDSSEELDLRNQEALAAPEPSRVDGDPEIVQAASDFMHTWLEERNPDRAFRFISTKCYPCVNLFLGEGESPKTSMQEMADQIREGLSNVLVQLEKRGPLLELVEAVDPVHPAVQILNQPEGKSFSLFALPNDLGKEIDCTGEYLSRGLSQQFEREYGDYYVASFRFTPEAGAEAPVLQLLWGREEGGWKITAYKLILP